MRRIAQIDMTELQSRIVTNHALHLANGSNCIAPVKGHIRGIPFRHPAAGN